MLTLDASEKDALIERILRCVSPEPNTGCWLWLMRVGKGGYAHIKVKRKHMLAHRVSYELFSGPIPIGLQIDHLCRQRCCVNPKHLEPVTPSTNIRRGSISEVVKRRHQSRTHCKRGHEFTAENTRIRINVWPIRICLKCLSDYNKARIDAQGLA
jgi:hypothetical protein